MTYNTSNGYVADDVGWPLSTLNLFLCFYGICVFIFYFHCHFLTVRVTFVTCLLNINQSINQSNHINFYILRCIMHLLSWICKDYKFDVQVKCASHSPRTTKRLPGGQVIVICDSLKIFWAPIISPQRLSATAELLMLHFVHHSKSSLPMTKLIVFDRGVDEWSLSRDFFNF